MTKKVEHPAGDEIFEDEVGHEPSSREERAAAGHARRESALRSAHEQQSSDEQVEYATRRALALARRDAAQALDQLLRLQAITAALSKALTPAEVASVAIHQGLAALDAYAGFLMLVNEEAERITCAGHAGYPPGFIEEFQDLPLDAPLPVAFTARTGVALFAGSREALLRDYPGLEGTSRLSTEANAVACLPLSGDHRVLGALALSFREPREFTESERLFMGSLAQLCCQALERSRLYEAERAARAKADEEQQRFAFLANVSAALASSLEYEATLLLVLDLAVPGLADQCSVNLMDDDGTIKRKIAVFGNTAKLALACEIDRKYPLSPSKPHPIVNVLQNGQPLLIPEVPDSLLVMSAHDDEHLEALRSLAPRSSMVVPLKARARTFGSLELVTSGSGRRYTERDLILAEDFARRAALAIDNARLYDSAQRAIQARQDLLAIVSHDLRNPLGVIAMNAALLERKAPEDEAGAQIKKRAATMLRAAERMTHLIRDLLDAATIESGRFSLESKPQDAAALVREGFDMMAPFADTKSIKLVRDAPPPGTLVQCDRDRVIQVLTNLIGNALKFTPEGGQITVRAEVCERDVVFSVTDSGVGIAEDQLPHIFDRYWMGKRSKGGGTGLGLYISKGIIDAHGGEIGAESKQGSGSTFHFTLPRVR